MSFKTILSVLIIASCITISSVSAGWQPFISLYGKDLIQDSSEDYSSGDGNGSSSIYSLNQNYYEVQEKAVADTWNNGNSMQHFKYFYTLL